MDNPTFWMGATRVVIAQGWQSQLRIKFGSINEFCRVAKVNKPKRLREFLRGKYYWKKEYVDLVMAHLSGDKKHLKPSVIYKEEKGKMLRDILFLWGTQKAMREEHPDLTYKKTTVILNGLKNRDTRKSIMYWKLRAYIAEKKYELARSINKPQPKTPTAEV